MANQTITVNTNFDSLIGLLAGETTTITANSRLTINSDPQLNRVLPGDFSVTEGELYIDGTTVRQINFSGASTLPVIGNILTSGSVTGQVIAVTGTTASGNLRLRSLNGVIPNGAALTFTGGKTATASSDDSVGWLRVLGTEGRSIITTRQGKVTVQGAWYQLAVSNGAASQVIQHYTTDVCPAVWVETGNGTNVYEIWLNAGSRWGTSIGNLERGKFFSNTNGNSAITFGNNTNGNIPVNGARIRVPNITLGSAATATPTVGAINATVTNRYKFNTASSGEVNINLCLGAGFYPVISQAYSVAISNTGWLQNLSVSEVSSICNLNNIGIGINAAVSWQPLILQSLKNLSMSNCSVSAYNTVTNGSALVLVNCQNVLIENCFFHCFARSGTTTDAVELLRCQNTTVNNCTFIGSFINVVTCNNVTFNNSILSDTTVGGSVTTNAVPGIFIESGSRNIKFDGISLIGGICRNAVISISASTSIKIRNLGTITDPVNLLNQADSLYASTGSNSDIEIARCFVYNSRTTIKTDQNSDTGVRLINVWGDAIDTLTNVALDSQQKGIFAGNNILGSTGIATTLTAVFGNHFYDCFFSITSGCVGIHFNEKTSNEPSASSYEITAGTPVFNATGGVLMRSLGDQIIWTIPWFILGHTGFANATFLANGGNNTTNHSYEYRLDTGTGFSGAWKLCTGANLSSEVISPTSGFRLQIRITCTNASATNSINGFFIRTVTTQIEQRALYPLDLVEASLTLAGLISGSEVRIYRVSDGVELGGIENSNSTFSLSYLHEGVDILVDIIVVSLAYKYIRIPNYPLTANNVSLPIQQQVDLSYSNPS